MGECVDVFFSLPFECPLRSPPLSDPASRASLPDPLCSVLSLLFHLAPFSGDDEDRARRTVSHSSPMHGRRERGRGRDRSLPPFAGLLQDILSLSFAARERARMCNSLRGKGGGQGMPAPQHGRGREKDGKVQLASRSLCCIPLALVPLHPHHFPQRAPIHFGCCRCAPDGRTPK